MKMCGKLVLILWIGALIGCGGTSSTTSSITPTPTPTPTPTTQGQWSTLPYTMPINPIHAALLNTGKVLVIAGSGNDRHNAFPISTHPEYEAAVWDTQSGTIMAQRIAWDMFCNGASTMPDGRVLIQGGTSVYGTEIAGNADTPFDGLANSAIFDPTTEMFSAAESTAHGRWYPTLTELGDGRIMTTSGLDENGNVNNTSEIYSAGWGPEISGNTSGFDPSVVFNFS